MAESFYLVKYQTDSDGQFLEEGSEIIDDAYVSPSLLEEMRQHWPFVERGVLEEPEGDSSFNILCFDEANIKEVKSWIENHFIRLINDSWRNLNDQTELNSDTHSNVLAKDDLDRLVDKFRYLTNLINLFRIKIDKYNQDITVVIRLV